MWKWNSVTRVALELEFSLAGMNNCLAVAYVAENNAEEKHRWYSLPDWLADECHSLEVLYKILNVPSSFLRVMLGELFQICRQCNSRRTSSKFRVSVCAMQPNSWSKRRKNWQTNQAVRKWMVCVNKKATLSLHWIGADWVVRGKEELHGMIDLDGWQLL